MPKCVDAGAAEPASERSLELVASNALVAQTQRQRYFLISTSIVKWTVWGAEIRFSCREAVFVDQSSESISSLEAV